MRLDCQLLLKSPPLTLLAGSASASLAAIARYNAIFYAIRHLQTSEAGRPTSLQKKKLLWYLTKEALPRSLTKQELSESQPAQIFGRQNNCNLLLYLTTKYVFKNFFARSNWLVAGLVPVKVVQRNRKQ